MAAGVIFMQWDSYIGGEDIAFFKQQPLTFNSRQERLHRLAPGDRLWLVSRCPDDGQYYFVAAVAIGELLCNAPGTERANLYGEYAIAADPTISLDLGRRFPADSLLRAFTFDSERPIRYGANIGQSLQTLRLLNNTDERVLNAALAVVQQGGCLGHLAPCGLWTKCDVVFARYFRKNWERDGKPLAFLLYDPPPSLPAGSPVFIHSDATLRLLARFQSGLFVAGHKGTVEQDERLAERERIWITYRAATLDPPTRAEFDEFWEAQNGVRGLFLMDEVAQVPEKVGWKLYSLALEWGYPSSVGYRYLTFGQCVLLLRLAGLARDANETYLGPLIEPGGRLG
jgi:hypothetical protein